MDSSIPPRDWFAAMAVQGLLAGKYPLLQDSSQSTLADDPKELVRLGYEIADELLRQSKAFGHLMKDR